jgi:hypothetical protein
MPVPTKEDITAAVSQEREIVACSAVRYGPLIALSIALHNGDTATVILEPVGRHNLLSALKALVPDLESIVAAPVTNGDLGPQVQTGHMSA